MTLKELHHFIFDELGVPISYLSGTRVDNLAVKYARCIFCTIAKDTGFSTWDISDIIERDIQTVNWDIRELRSLFVRGDFLSKSICESYLKIISLLETKN